jgi:hypothetical protein
MLLSKLIESLQNLHEEHGDMKVEIATSWDTDTVTSLPLSLVGYYENDNVCVFGDSNLASKIYLETETDSMKN